MDIAITGMYVLQSGSGGAVALFDATLDYVVTLKGLTLKIKPDNTYRWSSPAKQRIKNGEAQQDDQGRNIWDDHVRLALDPETNKVTKEAWAWYDQVLEAAIDAYELKRQSAPAGRASSARQAPAAAAAPARGARQAPAAAAAAAPARGGARTAAAAAPAARGGRQHEAPAAPQGRGRAAPPKEESFDDFPGALDDDDLDFPF